MNKANPTAIGETSRVSKVKIKPTKLITIMCPAVMFANKRIIKAKGLVKIPSTIAITPTKLAEYLIQKFHNFAVPVQVAESIIRTFSKDLVESSKSSIQNSAKIFKSLGSAYLSNAHHRLERNMHELDNITRNELNEARQILTSKINQLKTLSNRQFQDNRNKIGQNCLILNRSGKVSISNGKKEMDQLEKLIQMADPQNILKRGFSISSVNGKTIYSAEELKPGDILETRYSKGKSISTIQSKHEH